MAKGQSTSVCNKSTRKCVNILLKHNLSSSGLEEPFIYLVYQRNQQEFNQVLHRTLPN